MVRSSVEVQSGEVRGPGFKWAPHGTRKERSRAWIRRCHKDDAREASGGRGPTRVWREGRGRAGWGSAQSSGLHAPSRPYPPPRSPRSARCRCLPPAAAPVAASCCARGRPWPARRAQQGSARWSLGLRRPMACAPARRWSWTQSECRQPAGAVSSAPPDFKPRPSWTYRPAPGACCLAGTALLPKANTRPGATPARAALGVARPSPRSNSGPPLASFVTMDNPANLSGPQFPPL